MAERPLSEDDTRLYGPGVSDMKSGLLNILWAMRELEPADKDRPAIAVAMNPDEETGSVYPTNGSVRWHNAPAVCWCAKLPVLMASGESP